MPLLMRYVIIIAVTLWLAYQALFNTRHSRPERHAEVDTSHQRPEVDDDFPADIYATVSAPRPTSTAATTSARPKEGGIIDGGLAWRSKQGVGAATLASVDWTPGKTQEASAPVPPPVPATAVEGAVAEEATQAPGGELEEEDVLVASHGETQMAPKDKSQVVRDPFPSLTQTGVVPPVPEMNRPPSPHVKEKTPLLIEFERGWAKLLQCVVSYITAGWPPEDIYVVENTGVMHANKQGLLSLQNPYFLNHTQLRQLGVKVLSVSIQGWTLLRHSPGIVTDPWHRNRLRLCLRFLNYRITIHGWLWKTTGRITSGHPPIC